MRQAIFRSVSEALQQVEHCAELAGDNQEVQALLDAVGDRLRRALHDLRQELSPLSGLRLDGNDFRGSLAGLVEHARQALGAPLEAYIDEAVATALAPVQATHVLNMLREALANAVLHAGASRMALRAEVENGLLVVRLSDDGLGFDARGLRWRREGGLATMQRRADAVRGVLSVVSAPQAGTIVTLTVPLCQQASEH